MTKDTKSKVYQEVLEEIRNYIVDHQLQDGDRLPSERELAEQLNAGRSSVREALRAIELLGLIETRHGEGTFLRSYQPYYSVEILSTFILQETRSQQEVLQLKLLLESQVLSNLSGQISTDLYEKLLSVIVELPKEQLHTFLLQSCSMQQAIGYSRRFGIYWRGSVTQFLLKNKIIHFMSKYCFGLKKIKPNQQKKHLKRYISSNNEVCSVMFFDNFQSRLPVSLRCVHTKEESRCYEIFLIKKGNMPQYLSKQNEKMSHKG